MEIRLNKLISDAGICSRREADKFIEAGRVTVNGKLPEVGQKVTESDVVMLDDLRVQTGKQARQQAVRATSGKTQNVVFGEEKKKEGKPMDAEKGDSSSQPATRKPSGNKGLRPGKYIKYNKYAAARKAARSGEKNTSEEVKPGRLDRKALQDALQPKFGKSLSRSAIAQRLAASPKSAALRKTSKNNPVNKAKRAASRTKRKEE